MPGVPRELVEHTVNIDLKFKPVKQFLRRFNKERRKAIGEEVARLLAAGFIIEVFHPEWLANPVLVLKKNDTWRMCVDYIDLNKACPADPFAHPRIDQIIDATAGCERLRRQPSSLPLEPSAMFLCPLGSRVPRQLISAVCKIVFTLRLGAMFMPMWMTL